MRSTCFILILLLPLARMACCEETQARNIVRRRIVLAPLAQQAPATNAGLFVGVNSFTEDAGLTQLDYAVHDAIETAYVFVMEVKLIQPKHCYLLLSGDPVSPIVKRHLAELRRRGAKVLVANRTPILKTFLSVSRLSRQKSDFLVCSFSSHGFESNGDAYVMPADGLRDLLAESAVPLKRIETLMRNAKAENRLLLVDACQERVAAKGGQAGVRPDALIAALRKTSGQATLASCSPGEFSHENGALGGVGHGVFTWAFLDGLRGGAKAGEADNLIRLGDVADHVETQVTAWTTANRRRTQTPFFNGSVKTRRLPLARKADELTSIITKLQRAPLGGGVTAEFRDELSTYLRRMDGADPKNRQLLSYTQQYIQGDLDVSLFVSYVGDDRKRWTAPPPARPEESLTNSIGMKLSLIPAGQFKMGSRVSAEDTAKEFGTAPSHFAGEHPLHDVQIKQAFYLGSYEVTIGQFRKFAEARKYATSAKSVGGGIGWLEGRFKKDTDFSWRSSGWATTDDHPVANVSWLDAVAFCKWLSEKEKAHYRLPTEAEWEYACRASTNTQFSFGDRLAEFAQFGNVPDKDAADEFPGWSTVEHRDGFVFSAPVGSFKPNRLGLYDMHGNVWEWCSDAFSESYYQTFRSKGAVDPQGPDASGNPKRVLRGGGWSANPLLSRAASRAGFEKDDYFYNYGFRVARQLSPSAVGDKTTSE